MNLPVCIFSLLGLFGMTTDETREAIRQVTVPVFQEIGINFRARRIYSMQDPTGISDLNGRAQKFNRVMGLASILRRRKQYDICRANPMIFVTGPLIQPDGTRYIHGYASEVCARRATRTVIRTKKGPRRTQMIVSIGGVAQASGQMLNALGEDRFPQSGYAIAHEAGHLAGAHHTESPTLMNLDAMQYVWGLGSLHFAPESVQQIYACLPKEKKT